MSVLLPDWIVELRGAEPYGDLLLTVNEMAGVIEGMNIGTEALRVEVAHVPAPRGFDFENDGLIGSYTDIGGY